MPQYRIGRRGQSQRFVRSALDEDPAAKVRRQRPSVVLSIRPRPRRGRSGSTEPTPSDACVPKTRRCRSLRVAEEGADHIDGLGHVGPTIRTVVVVRRPLHHMELLTVVGHCVEQPRGVAGGAGIIG